MPATFTSLLFLALAQPAGGAAAPPAAGRVVLVVRTGALDREEVSPVESAPVRALWSLALAGVTWTRLAAPARQAGEPAAAAFLRELGATRLAASLEARGQRLATIDLGTAPEVEPAGPIRDLHLLFGAPPAATPEETAATSALRRALGGAPDATPAPAEPAARLDERLRGLAGATLAIVLVPARAAGAASIRERDEDLSRLDKQGGAQAHVIVVNLPDEGDGCLVARGPRLKEGRVFAAPRTARSAAALVALLLGGPPEAELSAEARDEAAVLLK